MTQVADVIHKTTVLVEDVIKLLETKTAKAIPEIAASLGAGPALAKGIDVVKEGVEKIIPTIVLVKDVLYQADVLVALFGIVPGLIQGVADIVKLGGDGLKDMGLGLDGAASTTKTIASGIGAFSNGLKVGEKVAESIIEFIGPEAVNGLIESLKHLVTTLDDFKKSVVVSK